MPLAPGGQTGRSGWPDAQRLDFAAQGSLSDSALLRPTEIRELQGNYARARRNLGWEPRTPFKALVELMVQADLERFG